MSRWWAVSDRCYSVKSAGSAELAALLMEVIKIQAMDSARGDS